MKPFLAKGYAKRKLHTGNQSVQFDEEREVERPLFYSTICVYLRFHFFMEISVIFELHYMWLIYPVDPVNPV